MPVALPFIAIGLAAAGTAAGAFAAHERSKAEASAAKFNEKVALNNSQAATQQASFDAKQIRRRNLILSGKQRSAAAKAGVLLTGSFSDVASDTAVQGELEALSRVYTGVVASQHFMSEAELQRSAAKNAKRGGRLAMAATLLTGIGQVGEAVSAKYPTFGASTSKTTSTSSALTTSRTSGLQSTGTVSRGNLAALY